MSNETSLKNVRVVLGTMTFSKQTDADDALKQLQYFFDQSNNKISKFELDTAYMYEETKTEIMLGNILTPEMRERLIIGTKANPNHKFRLTAEGVIDQLNTSLNNLKLNKADIFYLHFPDHKTPLEETLKACQKLYEEGKFKELGLSNYSSWQVSEIYNMCKNNGWVLPTVYQGMYNVITRDVEKELFPCIRYYNMRFYSYNPLAGGLLTERYDSYNNKPSEGRFKEKPFYLQRFWKQSYFESKQLISKACQEEGTKIVNTSISWLRNHSYLQEGDAIILGQSKFSQLIENMEAYNSPSLSKDMVKKLNEAWHHCKADCPNYFR